MEGTAPRPKIALLPQHVIDQIAAGEVVERPASVVKELVENALDAGATHITVEVTGGGKELIRVLDNGCGMTAAEARLALTRHATSKLSAFADLYGITTMGFRGEALPSIAAVSHLAIITRARGEEAATRLAIDGGKRAGESAVGAPVGTQIEVTDLLYNVPARKKFLKGTATESAHITEVITKLALAHPAVHLRLRHGERQVIDAPPAVVARDRVRQILGARVGKNLHAFSRDEGGIRVTAYLTPPAMAQSTARGLQLFIGQRPIKDRGLLHAVVMGYGELLARGRYPVAVVFVDAPAGTVDVNVHPQKHEVRFSDARAVQAAVRHTVARAVASAPWLSDSPGALPVRVATVAGGGQRASEMAHAYGRELPRVLLPMGRDPGRGGAPAWGKDESAASSTAWGTSRTSPAGPLSGAQPQSSSPSSSPLPSPSGSPSPLSSPAASPPPAAAASPLPAGQKSGHAFFSELSYVGQLDRTFLLCEGSGELVLIDQHAAHERVAFARLSERYRERAMPVQRLLFPVTIDLSPAEAATVTEAREELSAMGLEIEPFGGDTFAIKAVPAEVRERDPAEMVTELIAELSSVGGSRAIAQRIDTMLATIACHSVVRAGDTLSDREAQALLCDLDRVPSRDHCPHGRPVLLRISLAEIARRFGRS